MKFALHDFLGGAITRMVYKSNPKGGVITSHVTFEPDTEYETNDETLIKLIKGEIGDVRQKSLLTSELKQSLIEAHIPYETIKCKTCTGAKPHALYNPFKILEDN